MYRDTYDVLVSRRIAERCGQPHQVLVLGDEFVRASPDYLDKAVFISDGYMGLSGAAELYLNGQARKVAPVRVTGNYGGELLRGFRAFKGTVPKGNFLPAGTGAPGGRHQPRLCFDDGNEATLVYALPSSAGGLRPICDRALAGDRSFTISR